MLTIFPQASVDNLEFFGEYQLLSSHEKAMNLVNQSGHLVSFHPSVKYMSPFGMVFRQEDYDYLRSTCGKADSFTVESSNTLWMGNSQVLPSSRTMELKLLSTANSGINSAIFSKFGREINGFGLSNQEMLEQKLAPVNSMFDFLAQPNLHTAQAAIKYIGLGQGLTPSFDDLLVGVLASLFWLQRDQPYLGPLSQAIAQLDLDAQTTTVSKHYLIHALLGEFSYPLLKLMSAFKHPTKSIEDAIKQFIQHGHTSGRDTLLGLAIAFQHFEQ